ncbi:MAG: radical SAM protein [Desulfobacterales bacterium]
MPRLLLINPSNRHKGLGNIQPTAFPPLNLPYLAALTPRHYQIEIIDENIEPFRFKEADVAAITSYTATVNRAYQIADSYRKKNIPVIMGGIHVSMMPEEAIRYCDAVVVGEAESIWAKVLEDVENHRLQKIYNGKRLDLKDLPIPDRSILKNSYYRWGSIQTSRGCPMNCSFCSVSVFNGRSFRRRPLDSVIEELEGIPQKWILICDDNIIGYGKEDLEWARRFFERVIEKKIKKIFFAQSSIQIGEDKEFLKLASRAGLRIVFVGMESIDKKTLSAYGKNVNLVRLQNNQYKNLIANIRKAGILFLGAFVVGGDGEDKSVFDSTLQFIKSSGIDILQVTKLTPLPGTKIWEKMHQEKRMLNLEYPQAWDDFRFSRILYQPADMDIEDIYEGYAYLKNNYFSPLVSAKRTLSTLMNLKSLSSTIIAHKINKSYKKAFRESDNFHYAQRPDLIKKFRISG